MKMLSSACEVAGLAKRWRDQQCACRFWNLCDSTRRIRIIDKFGTRQYIKQRGHLNVTQHQTLLTVLESRALRYQNSRTYKELEDEQLLNEAIDETGMIPCSGKRGDEMNWVEVAEQLKKEIMGVLEYLLEVHGLPPGRKGGGVTRLIYENLNGLQSTMSRKMKSWRRHGG
jgi:hypothetical protein